MGRSFGNLRRTWLIIDHTSPKSKPLLIHQFFQGLFQCDGFVLRLDCFPFLLLHPLECFVERSLKFLLWMIFWPGSELQIATGCLHLGSPQLFCLAPRNPFARLHRNINGKLVKSARCLCTPFPMRGCQLSGFRLSFLPVIKTPSTKPFSLSINRPADLHCPLSFVCGPAHAWNGAFRSSCIFPFCLQFGLQLGIARF